MAGNPVSWQANIAKLTSDEIRIEDFQADNNSEVVVTLCIIADSLLVLVLAPVTSLR